LLYQLGFGLSAHEEIKEWKLCNYKKEKLKWLSRLQLHRAFAKVAVDFSGPFNAGKRKLKTSLIQPIKE